MKSTLVSDASGGWRVAALLALALARRASAARRAREARRRRRRRSATSSRTPTRRRATAPSRRRRGHGLRRPDAEGARARRATCDGAVRQRLLRRRRLLRPGVQRRLQDLRAPEHAPAQCVMRRRATTRAIRRTCTKTPASDLRPRRQVRRRRRLPQVPGEHDVQAAARATATRSSARTPATAAGSCKPGATRICVPFSCNTGQRRLLRHRARPAASASAASSACRAAAAS